MKERHSKKELTRLILTALVLAGGSFYMPMAEAAEFPSTTKNPTADNTEVVKRTDDSSYEFVYLKDDSTYTGIYINFNDTNTWKYYGGYSKTTNGGGRTVTLNNGTVAGIGGFYGATTGTITNNTATVQGGTISNAGFVTGGYSKSGTANYNKVTITGGTIGANSVVTGGNATNVSYNSVSISGGTFGSGTKIGGVYSTATDDVEPAQMHHNSLNLYGSTTGLENAIIAGAYSESNNSITCTDNNIYIGGERVYTNNATTTTIADKTPWYGGATNTVKEIKGVDTIVLRKVNWSESVPVLKATDGIRFQNGAKLDISNISIVNPAPGTLTLLDGAWSQGPTTLQSITVTYNGTGSPVTLNSGTKSKVINDGTPNTPQTLTNNVTLKKLVGKTTLSINDAYNKVQYTIAKDKLTSIDLAGWDASNTVALSTTDLENGLTAGSITATGTFAPALADGSTKDILTASEGFFTNTQIATAIAYNPTGGTFADDEDKGVTLSGNIAKGVLASTDGSKLTYYSATRDVTNNIVLGTMDWGTGRTITGTGYTFGNVTGVDATNLAFAFTNDQAGALAASSNMTLLSGATGLTAGKIVTYKNSGTNHTQAVSYSTANGAALSGTLTGTVSTAANAVNYQASSMTLGSIDLMSWNGTASSTLPTGWTKNGAISVGGTFTKPTMAAGTSLNILTATSDSDYFSDANIDSAIAYQSSGDFSNTVNGVTLSGSRVGGVKSTNSGKALTYFAEKNDTNTITFGQMAWGTSRTADSTYDFSGVTSIDASNLSFTNPLAVGTTASLLTNANNLAAGLPITYASGTSHTQSFTGEAVDNGIKLAGTINGTVSTTAGQVDYTVDSKSITGIDLAGWDSTKAAYSLTGWTNGLTNNSINAAGFTAPTTLTAGNSIDIVTTGTDDYFTDDYITGAQKYGPSGAPSSDTDKGVTFTGSQQKGVKASDNGQNLVYAVGDMTVSDITLGNMELGTNGVVTSRTADTHYTFDGSTKIDATNLKFDKPADVKNSTLVDGATGITASNTVTRADHSQAITNAAMGGGITVSGTLNGTVAAVDGGVNYTVNNKTVSSMDLSGWDTTTEGTTLPDTDWTGSNVTVNANSFAAAAPTENKTIFTTTTDGFFGNVTGDLAYKSGAAFSETGTEGITLSGTKSGGVKKSNDGSDLEYIAEVRTVNNITLGNMTWGTGRAMPATGYTFSVADNGVDASGLKFSFTGDTVNTLATGANMSLLTNATGLGAGLTVKGSPVSQSISYDLDNVATLNGTLTGTVATAANTVTYTVTDKKLNSVDISAWNGTATDSVDASWEKNASGISVTGSGFTTPTAVGDYNILTASLPDFFTGAQIADSIAYKTGSTFSETASNITLSGTQDRGVKVNDTGTALQYSIGKANINNIKIGNVTYEQGGTLINKSADIYDYSQLNSNGLDISGFGLSMTDEQKKSAAANDSMTLVQANTTLSDIAAKETGKSSYTYANTSATSDLTVKGTVTGNVAAANSNVIYTVASNTASALTINSVTWNSGTYARPDSEIAYSTALVNADNITFTGVDTLSKNDTMVLVSNYGDEVNKVRGGIFTLSNGKTGKGHAYYDSATHSLVYVVDRGVDDEVETKTAIGTKTIIINEQPHQGDVPGGEAEGDGEAKDNETIIKKSHIKKNPDGTGGDTNGCTSEDGDADENKLDIEESEIDGDATGGQSDTGNTDDNETIIKKKSVIHGGVAGGETLGGHGGSRRNKTTVEESTVEGDVDGGKTGGDGETEENEVVITGSSKIGGDVNGGHSGGDGDSSGNEVTVDNSTVDGDVNGGKSDGKGNTKNNKVDIKKGSKIGGSVHGGHSGGSGDSTGNEVTVDGSEVDGNVMGGRTKDGNANNNTVNIDGGSTINGSVYGGYSDTGDASGNNVNIGTGKINGDIYGGYSGGTGSTINNTVTLYGDADVSGSNIIGGSNGSDSTGNTLNIGKGTESWTGGGQTVKNISSFDTLNFTALPWNSDTPALTIGDGSATDLSNTTVTAQQVAFTGVKTISVGSTMMFLDQSNVAAGKKATNINSGSDFTVGTATEGAGKLVLDASGNVVYQVESAGASRQTHNTVMAAEAAAVALNAGNDFILSAREGLARKENIGKDGIAVFAKIGGGAMRQETGSHVNVNMWNGIVALGRKNVQKESTTEYGVFIEHGWGNFSTHSDNAQRGDGSVDYTGGGLLGKWTKADGLYVEGSLRIGSMHEKANNLLRDTVRGYGYDESTTYKGFHLGVGKEFAIKDGNTVEVYGKYFYNRKDGMNFNAGLDEYNLDAVTSQILRVGARYTMKRERWNYYGDLSYEHELDGQAKGRANGMAIRGADTSGGSVRLELGAKLLANEKSPWTLDLNLTGYAGKKQGLQGGVSVKFMF